MKPVLLHACCAPCASAVYESLADDFDVTVFYYNPNIDPEPEYRARLGELERFAALRDFPLFTGGYDAAEWTRRVEPYQSLGERSERCRECFRVRLDGSFRKAKELGIDAVTTTLTVSPHKDADMINGVGKELESRHGIEFIEGDFKKSGGYRRSIELSRRYDFYRQNYCGCVYSRRERERHSGRSRSKPAYQSIHTISS